MDALPPLSFSGHRTAPVGRRCRERNIRQYWHIILFSLDFSF